MDCCMLGLYTTNCCMLGMYTTNCCMLGLHTTNFYWFLRADFVVIDRKKDMVDRKDGKDSIVVSRK